MDKLGSLQKKKPTQIPPNPVPSKISGKFCNELYWHQAMAFTDLLVIGLVLQVELQGEELYWKIAVFTKVFTEHARRNYGVFQKA